MLETPEQWETCQGDLITEWSQTKRKKSAAAREDEELELESALTSGLEMGEFGVSLTDFLSFFGPVFPYKAPFGNHTVYPVTLYVGSMLEVRFDFDFTRD